ncbi:MAG: SNF2 helicase associated domain-containing protein, partial [Clostridiales bacterium]|nr:SNF2 helicase associated domain-containing protein [Clostridiales bacterium]
MELNLTEFGIRQFINNGQEFFYGRQKAQEGRVTGIRLVDSDKIKFAGKITESSGKEYLTEAEFDIKGLPVACRCSCESECRCRHTAALLFELMKTKGKQAGDLSANYVASKNLLNLFEKRRLEDMKTLSVAAAEKYSIEPLLYFENGKIEAELYLSKYGKRKKKIEDIFEFAIDVDRNTGKAYKEYGYNINGFTESGKALLNFIYSSSEIKAGFIALSNLSEDKSRFILSGNSLDSFFELYKDKSIDAVIDGEKIKLKTESGEPLIKTCVEITDGKAVLKKNFKISAVFNTNIYGYILLENKFYRTQVPYAGIIKDIETVFGISGGSEVVFESADFSRLVDYVIPTLVKFDLLVNPGKIFESLSMTPFVSQIYMEKKGRGICGKVKFVYGDTVIDYNDKRAYREYRNDRAETVFKLVLEGMGFYDNGPEGFIMLREDEVFSFFKYGISALSKNTEVFLSDELKVYKKSADKSINLGIRYEGNLIEIDFDTSTIDLSELNELLNAYNEKKKYYRFSDGRFLSIDDNKMFLKFVRLFNLSKKELQKGSFYTNSGRLMIFDRLFDEHEKSLISMDKGSRRLIERYNESKSQGTSLNSFYGGILRDYQKKGYEWLKSIGDCGFGGILADDMGLGKTIQVISYLNEKYKTEGEQKPSLIICPTSLIFNWEAELEAYGGGLEYEIVYGAVKKRRDILKLKTDIFVTSYETLKRDFETYKNMDFAVIVADEAQYLKNRTTRNFTAATALKGEVRFALTGTPFENNLGELWSVFEFVMPGYLGSYKKFVQNFEKPIMLHNDRGRMKEFKKLISPFILRREKGDVLRDLPEKTETCRYILMTDEQAKLYKAELLKARGVI